MGKFKLAFMMLFVVSVVYAVMLASGVNNYWHRIAEATEPKPPLGQVYVQPEPYPATSEGSQFAIAGATLFVTWLTVANLKVYKCRKKTLSTLALIFLFTVPIFTQTVHAESYIRIGVLCAGDEEFMTDEPELTTLGACNRLALSEGQKENKKGKESDLSD